MKQDLIVQQVDKARALLALAKDATDAKRVVDMAHAAEIYAKRQHLSEEAITYAHAIKVDALALLGEFIKHAPKNQGTAGQLNGRRASGGLKINPPEPQPPSLDDLGIDKNAAHAARKLATLKADSPETFAEVRLSGTTSVLQRKAHVAANSGENEWYTPEEYIAAARTAMGGIDLDPASTPAANAIVQATQIFTTDDDGLQQSWHGRVWMNPPYAQPLITDFALKLVGEVHAEHVKSACVLVNNATETEWFNVIADIASAVCFPKGRIRFWHTARESATPLQGQAILYVGRAVARFRDAFSAFGHVWVRP